MMIKMIMKKLLSIGFLLAMFLSVSAKELKLYVDSDELNYGIIKKENYSRNPELVGDQHLRNKAYGLFQIRLPYLQDVNRIAGTNVRKVWGKNKLTIEDMKDEAKATWAVLVYLSHYGELYKRKTGNIPTIEVYARIHNGGPNGWKKSSTVKYGKVVVLYCELKDDN